VNVLSIKMTQLTAIPGLPPDAIEQLTACGIESAELLAAIPAAEIHRVLELTAWQKGRLNRAPTLAMVNGWARLARQTAGEFPVEDIPEAIVIPRAPQAPAVGGYFPRSQRAQLETAGPPVPAAPPAPLPDEIKPALISEPSTRLLPKATPLSAPPAVIEQGLPVTSGFSTFDDYQAGKVRVTPLSRFSIDAPLEEREAIPMERPFNTDDMPRTVRRGVVYPAPVLLGFGAIIALVWRVALLAGIAAVPWLLLMVPRPSVYKLEILAAVGILVALGTVQLLLMHRIRCPICTCHLFWSRNTVKNRKAHLIPGFGYTASLALHLLIFQWFRCMYCGTAIKLWSTKAEREAQAQMG
jgi:hypothetical protein